MADEDYGEIVEIMEIGEPNSQIQRANNPISELIGTFELGEEINRLLAELRETRNRLFYSNATNRDLRKRLREINKAYEGHDF